MMSVNGFYKSTDNTTWTLVTSTASTTGYIYANIFYLTFTIGNIIYKSPDLTTLTQHTSNISSVLDKTSATSFSYLSNDIIYTGKV